MNSSEQEEVIANTQKGEDKQHLQVKKIQRPSKFTWDHSLITIDTVLVDLPKKVDRIVKPEYDIHEKKLKDIDEAIK